MKEIIKKAWRFQDRLKSLRRIMPTMDALRLTFPKSKAREMEIFLTPIQRKIILRRGTSDVWCLQNIFIDQEYDTPFRVDPKVIIDAGANIGMTTLFFSQKYPQAKIIAIEPEASNFEVLRKNCGGLPNVTLINAALWPTEQTLAISDTTAEKWAFSVTNEKKSSGSTMVKAVTISGLLKQIEAEHIDILKLDIEGAERELFTTGAESWLGSVGQMIIELHDRIVPGCASAFYSKIIRYPFIQEIKADNVFINFKILA